MGNIVLLDDLTINKIIILIKRGGVLSITPPFML